MANEEHLKILRQGVEVWNEWWEGEPEQVRADLDGADLTGANLKGALLACANLDCANLRDADLRDADLECANLDGANLDGANLGHTNLREATLRNAELRGADLTKADLMGARLGGADFAGAKLTSADLTGVDLEGANLGAADLREARLESGNLMGAVLVGVDLAGATVGWTSFGRVDLSEVKGLNEVVHSGPSSIGVDTLERSGGKIPATFLRGCGVPESVISAIPGLFAGDVVQYYSCFISYSSQDEGFAKRLHADLQDNGVRCWFAPEDMKIGDKILETLDHAVRLRDKLLLVLSESALASGWVEDEVTAAFEEERSRETTVLFPVRLDDAVMDSTAGWAGKLRGRHIGDFREWKDHDKYQAAFQRLLRDLKVEKKQASE